MIAEVAAMVAAEPRRAPKRLFLAASAGEVTAATGCHADALCGQRLSAEGLTLTHGLAGALCLTCIAGITPTSKDPNPISTTRSIAGRSIGHRPAPR